MKDVASILGVATEFIAKTLGDKGLKRLEEEMKAELPLQAYDSYAESQDELAKARASAREAQIKLQDLQRAVSSIVLRLKVLDVEALEKDLGEDGTVPLRLALSELKQLLAAYDGMPKSNMPDYGSGLTYATTTAPTNWYYNTTSNNFYTSSNTGGTP